jgi:predicted component of type VI protein secretion system
MAWKTEVHPTGDLFLRPQRLQQADRYLDNGLESWTLHLSPHPLGFARPEIDRGLVRAAPEDGAGQVVWLTAPTRADETREVSREPTETPRVTQSGRRW